MGTGLTAPTKHRGVPRASAALPREVARLGGDSATGPIMFSVLPIREFQCCCCETSLWMLLISNAAAWCRGPARMVRSAGVCRSEQSIRAELVS